MSQIEPFIVGQEYVWIGPKTWNCSWNSSLEHWKDNQPHKCTEYLVQDGIILARFLGIPDRGAGPGWCYNSCRKFIQLVDSDQSEDIPGV